MRHNIHRINEEWYSFPSSRISNIMVHLRGGNCVLQWKAMLVCKFNGGKQSYNVFIQWRLIEVAFISNLIGCKANLKRQIANSSGLTVTSIEHMAKSIGKFVLSSNFNGQTAKCSGSIATSNTQVVISIRLFVNSTEKRCSKRHYWWCAYFNWFIGWEEMLQILFRIFRKPFKINATVDRQSIRLCNL